MCLPVVPEKHNKAQIPAVGNHWCTLKGPRDLGKVLADNVCRSHLCSTQLHWCLTDVHSILSLLHQVEHMKCSWQFSSSSLHLCCLRIPVKKSEPIQKFLFWKSKVTFWFIHHRDFELWSIRGKSPLILPCLSLTWKRGASTLEPTSVSTTDSTRRGQTASEDLGSRTELSQIRNYLGGSSTGSEEGKAWGPRDDFLFLEKCYIC